MSFFSRSNGGAAGAALFTVTVLLVASETGCFNEPKVDVGAIKRCKTNDNCPSGYRCTPVGTCCRSANGQTCDMGDASSLPTQLDGMVLDSSRDQHGSVDGVAAVLDVAIEAGRFGSGGASGSSDVGQSYDTSSDGGGGTGGAGGLDANIIGTGGMGVDGGGAIGMGGVGTGGASGGGGMGGVGIGGMWDAGVDAPVGCSAGKKDCGGGVCVDPTGCCATADCTGTCQTCSNNACIAVVNADDPDSCKGTCDATGTCKSKQGQSCQTVAAGCASGTTCSPDGTCCDEACTSPCMACDVAGHIGICTAVATGQPHGGRTSCGTDATCAGSCAGRADGQCSYPATACGPTAICSGTDKIVPQSKCSNGVCPAAAATTCAGGFACANGACSTTCTTAAECQAGYNCAGQTCTSHKFRGGPCVITTDVAGTASAVYVRGDDEHIYYSAYSPGGMATWIAVSGADGAAVASTSDLDCASDGASGTVQLVALGAMPLGDVLHASGTGSSFSPFVDLGFSTSQGPSVMGNGGPGLALISPVSGGTPSSTITYRTYDSSWAAVSQTQSAPSLTKAFTSGVDADIVGNGFGTVGFVAFADDGTMAEVLLTNYMGTSWGASYFSPPTGSTFQYSPSMCIAHAGTTYESQLVFVVTAGSRLWYSHGSSSGFSTWQKISDVAVASAPDCVINSYSASGAVQINVVALTETGSVLHVHGPWAGTFSSVDLGVYP